MPEPRAAAEPWPLRLLDHLTQACNVVGSLLIFALMVLIAADVIGREAAGLPISGVPEMVALSIVAIVFLQAPQALKAGKLTRSSALADWLTPRAPGATRLVESLFDLAGITVMSVILYASWPLFARAWSRNDFIGAVGDFTAPTWPVKAMILLGSALLIAQFAARILRRHL